MAVRPGTQAGGPRVTKRFVQDDQKARPRSSISWEPATRVDLNRSRDLGSEGSKSAALDRRVYRSRRSANFLSRRHLGAQRLHLGTKFNLLDSSWESVLEDKDPAREVDRLPYHSHPFPLSPSSPSRPVSHIADPAVTHRRELSPRCRGLKLKDKVGSTGPSRSSPTMSP